jgi:hypothetical protein
VAGTSTYTYVGGEPLAYSDYLGLARDPRKFPLKLPDGYGARVDQVPGTDLFEIHVCNPGGDEIGLYGKDGWFKKHGHNPEKVNVPQNVENSLKGIAIDEGRRRGEIPGKGKANIKGLLKRLGGGLGALGSNSYDEVCSRDPGKLEGVCQ